MRITPDTNILVRIFTEDDPDQARRAEQALNEAETIAIPVPTLCELVWVLRQAYRIPSARIADAVMRLADTGNVVMDRAAVKAGIDLLNAGGDFADGVIAHQGRRLGGETFVSFDEKATRLLSAQGHEVRLL